MPGQKKVVVFCPRGRQGESVCRYLAQDPQYEVFAVTRLAKDLENIDTNITSTQDVQAVGGQLPEEALKAFEGLKKLGVNLVYGDFLDASTFPQLLHGAFGCWWNVSFFSNLARCGGDFDAAAEADFAQGKCILDACQAAQVKLVCFGLLSKTLSVDMAYFRGSERIEEYARAHQIPSTFIWQCSWYDNLLPTKMGQMVKGEDGTFSVVPPVPNDTVNIWTAVEQTGAFAAVAYRDPGKWAGKGMSMISEIMTYGGDLPKKLSAITGKQVKPWNLTEEQWSAEENKTRLAPMWGILDNMYRYYVGFDFAAHNCPEQPREIVPELWTLDEWAKQSREFHEFVGYT